MSNNIKDIFQEFENNKNFIMDKLHYNTDKLSYKKLWDDDDYCFIKMGEANKSYRQSSLSKRSFICKNCNMISNITNLNNIYTPFKIPSIQNKLFIISKINDIYLSFDIKNIELNCQHFYNIASITNCNEKNSICKGIEGNITSPSKTVCDITEKERKTTFQYIELDYFSNNIIITWKISSIFSGFGISSNIIYKGFICSGSGYMLEEYTEDINIRNVEKKDIMVILYQIFSMLKILSDYDFMIGGININTIKLSNGDVHYKYDNLMIMGNLKVTLKDLSNSSINLFPRNVKKFDNDEDIIISEDKNERNLRVYRKNIITSQKSSNFIRIEKRILYKIDETIQLYKITEGIDLGLHNSELKHRQSLNAYLFMILLYNEKNIKEFINETPLLKNIWDSLWLPLEIYSIEDSILKLGDPNENKFLNILQSVNLRYDALDVIWNGLKNTQF